MIKNHIIFILIIILIFVFILLNTIQIEKFKLDINNLNKYNIIIINHKLFIIIYLKNINNINNKFYKIYKNKYII
jgi:hypothetical protein